MESKERVCVVTGYNVRGRTAETVFLVSRKKLSDASTLSLEFVVLFILCYYYYQLLPTAFFKKKKKTVGFGSEHRNLN